MERIKEEDIRKVLKDFEYKNLFIEITGIFKQRCYIENSKIGFLNDIKFEIKNNKNLFIFDLSYIEEIFLLQKNKLKLLTNNNVEILILFL